MEFKDYYKILGRATADDKAIKTAYRKLARKHHPDVNKGERADRFKEISEAYRSSSDPEKRKRYDTLGPDWQRYAQAGAGGRGVVRRPPVRAVEVRFEERRRAAASRTSSARSSVTWAAAAARPGGARTDFEVSGFGGQGGGRRPGAAATWRRPSSSRSRRPSTARARRSRSSSTSRARPCGGAGNVKRQALPAAATAAAGPRATRNLDVKIPAGVDTGSRVRVAAEGPSGARAIGRPRGSLPARHGGAPRRASSARATTSTLDAADAGAEAALGGEVSVPTLQGPGLDEDPGGDVERQDVPAPRLRHAASQGRRGRRPIREGADRDPEPGSARERRSCSRS